MRYNLLFAGQLVGVVEEDDADFPTFFGRYEISEQVRQLPELRHLLEYVAYSVRVWPLVMDGPSDEMLQDEKQFSDIIESEEWMLRDEGGVVTPILVPLFGPAGQINWRLNPTR